MKNLKKLIGALVLTSIISGCATTMTPQQHNLFARDYSLLNMCIEKGMIDQNLAAQGNVLLKERFNNYQSDESVIDGYIQQYYSQKSSVDMQTCNKFSVELKTQLIENQRFRQDVADMNKAIANFGEATKQNMPVRTNCMNYGYGMASCTTY